MNLDNLTHTSGEWLRGTGSESDIVMSSRIRLARNLAAFPFTNRASAHQKADMEGLLRDRITKMDITPHLDYFSIAGLSPRRTARRARRSCVSSRASGDRSVCTMRHFPSW